MSNVYYNKNDTIESVKENKTLKAKWKIKEYTYNLVTNGGTLATQSTESGANKHGFSDSIKYPFTELPTINRDGYDFKGWYTSPNFSGTAVSSFQNENLTYYAKWEPIKYTINFDLGTTTGSSAYFKYSSLSFTYDNLPLTLGHPVAEGYTFGKWHTNDASATQDVISEINTTTISSLNFDNNEATVHASWSAESVTVTEEIYRQSDASSSAYEVVKIIQSTCKVGSTYSKSSVTIKGCEENEDLEVLPDVISKDLIIKRYFKRKTYTATLLCLSTYGTYVGMSSSDDSEESKISFTYSDNDIALPIVVGNDPYTFVTWHDENNKAVTSISAYSDYDRTYYATFSTRAPVEGTDFTISYGNNNTTITATTESSNLGMFNSVDGVTKSSTTTSSEDIGTTTTNPYWTCAKDTVYSSSVTNTQYAQIYFPAVTFTDNEKVIAYASDTTNVPIKFSQSAPSSNKFETTSTTVKVNTDNIEMLEDDGDYVSVASGTTLTPSDKTEPYIFRYGETYNCIASTTISVVCNDLQSQSAPTITDEMVYDSTYNTQGYVTISSISSNGRLQYKEGEANGWITVSSATGNISFDDGVVYFRYAAYTDTSTSTSYAASPAVAVTIKKATVTVTVTTSSTTYPSLQNLAEQTYSVTAGKQLSSNEDYIEWANNVSLYGYTQPVPRNSKFLSSTDPSSTTLYNEANIITGDEEGEKLQLYTVWNPIVTSNFTYMSAIKLSDTTSGNATTSFDLDLSSPKTDKFTYGEQKDIKFDTDLIKNELSNDAKIKLLNYLDETPNYFPDTIRAMIYSQDDGNTWSNVDEDSSALTDGTFSLSATSTPSSLDTEYFCTIFKPVCYLKEVTNSVTATFYSATGDTSFWFGLTGNDDNKYYQYYTFDANTSTIDVYSEDDPRIDTKNDESLIPLENDADGLYEFTTTNDATEISIKFHATLELPSSELKTITINAVEYSGEPPYTVNGNSVAAIEGWTAEVSDSE